MDSRSRPLLIFDGDCGFCRRRVEGIRARTGERVDYAPSDEVAAEFPEIDAAVYSESVVLVQPDRSWSRGARAVFETLALGRGPSRLLLGLYRHLPGFRPVSEWGYRLVASNRIALSRLELRLRGSQPDEASFRIAGWVFQKVLALTYLAAFLSLLPQLLGLVGADGILPVADALPGIGDYAASEERSRWLLLPSFVWWSASDAALLAHVWIGVGLATLLLLGLAPALAAAGLWMTYVSITAAGNVFLSFQWDALLCEVGLLAVFLVPWSLRSRRAHQAQPAALARWLGWLLLVRLMFFSGVVKLASSGTPAEPNVWLDLSALQHHFETQPLPTPLAAYAHALPDGILSLFCVVMFLLELALPIAVFCGRRGRLVAAGGFALLQLGIAATGNYGFFNLITLALCALLVDDAAWNRLRGAPSAPAGALPGPAAGACSLRSLAPRAPLGRRLALGARNSLLLGYAVLAVWFGTLQWARLAGRVAHNEDLAKLGEAQLGELAALRTVNSYGLFARMTTARFEVELQGSDDGQDWRSYDFRYKPDDSSSGLGFMAPHMPRLDWQMWFLPLQGYQRSAWFQALLRRLLEGSEPVAGLFAENPFPDAPPKYVQARFLRYELETPAQRRESGQVWRTEDLGPFVSPLTLEPR